jgi:hypothetical protein
VALEKDYVGELVGVLNAGRFAIICRGDAVLPLRPTPLKDLLNLVGGDKDHGIRKCIWGVT